MPLSRFASVIFIGGFCIPPMTAADLPDSELMPHSAMVEKMKTRQGSLDIFESWNHFAVVPFGKFADSLETPGLVEMNSGGESVRIDGGARAALLAEVRRFIQGWTAPSYDRFIASIGAGPLGTPRLTKEASTIMRTWLRAQGFFEASDISKLSDEKVLEDYWRVWSKMGRDAAEVDPENWTGRIVNPQSGERSICRRRDVSMPVS
jgi:hypothetical protein